MAHSAVVLLASQTANMLRNAANLANEHSLSSCGMSSIAGRVIPARRIVLRS